MSAHRTRDGLVGLIFVALAAVWTFPLVLHISTHIPGAGLSDNALCLWSFWWMRRVFASGGDFFATSYLFAPVGVDMTLHTHFALPAFVGATLLGKVSIVAALNIMILAAVALNGFCMYWLALRLTRDRAAAMLAGIIFGWSPYLSAHLNGQFNLVTAWTIPLFALAVSDAIRGSTKWAVIAGLILAATIYIEYYYTVYEIALALLVLGLESRGRLVMTRASSPYPAWCSALVGTAVALDLLVLLAIALTGGAKVQLGRIGISMRDSFNPRQALWVLLALALIIRLRPRVRFPPQPGWSWAPGLRALAAVLAVFAVGASPLIWKGLRLVVEGRWVSQQYYWRSAPVGIDVATFVLGNPYQGVWGPGIRRLYSAMHIDFIESGGWLGIAPLGLAAYAVRRKWSEPLVRRWVGIGAAFFVWALGSHVVVAGWNSGLIGPETLLRYVPVAANARMPGRAIVMVYMALAVICAIAAAGFGADSVEPSVPVPTSRWRTPAVLALAAFVLVDFAAAPFAVVSVQCPAIYEQLRERPEQGALAELPLGVGDGLGQFTLVDFRMFVCQTVHERPLVGGYMSRLPGNVLTAYLGDPLLAAWLRLSGARADLVPARPMPDRELAGQRLRADGISFVVLNRESATPELRHYVERVLPLELIARDRSRSLYVVER